MREVEVIVRVVGHAKIKVTVPDDTSPLDAEFRLSDAQERMIIDEAIIVSEVKAD